MELPKVIFVLLTLECLIIRDCCSLMDPVSITLIGGISFGLTWLFSNDNKGKPGMIKKYIGKKIGVYEGCEDYWIPGNIIELELDLRSNVYGQPAALDIVISALRSHLHGYSERALMLSFHGSPGTGKNFVSSKILKQMFRNGEKTDYVHTFRSSIDFPSKEDVEKYKKEIVRKVFEMSLECHRSVIVFDEVEKMPEGILDVLSGFVKSGKVGDHDFRRIIFILLSNSGSKLILTRALESWNEGIRREDMDIVPLKNELSDYIYNIEGGFHQTGLMKSYGITHIVPFLPLEKNHVVQCLENEVKKQGQEMSHDLMEQVLQELTFVPREIGAFSYSGCKGVGDKAAVLIEREIRRRKKSRRG